MIGILKFGDHKVVTELNLEPTEELSTSLLFLLVLSWMLKLLPQTGKSKLKVIMPSAQLTLKLTLLLLLKLQPLNMVLLLMLMMVLLLLHLKFHLL